MNLYFYFRLLHATFDIVYNPDVIILTSQYYNENIILRCILMHMRCRTGSWVFLRLTGWWRWRKICHVLWILSPWSLKTVKLTLLGKYSYFSFSTCFLIKSYWYCILPLQVACSRTYSDQESPHLEFISITFGFTSKSFSTKPQNYTFSYFIIMWMDKYW